MSALRFGIVYTVNPPELVELVEREVQSAFAGCAVELRSYADPSILAEAAAAGHVTRGGAVRLVRMYLQAVEDGADAILNCCSTVGEVAEAAQGLARCLGVPIVRIDEAMCQEAVRLAAEVAERRGAPGARPPRVGVLATAATTLEPTGTALQRAAREQGLMLEVVNGLVEGTAGLSHDEYRAALLDCARELEPQVDALALAQGSMAYCEPYLQERLSVPVLSSPRYGAADLARRLGR